MVITKISVFVFSILCSFAPCASNMEGYIVGGQDASIEKFPHSVFLAIECVTEGGKDTYVCGASILNQKFLLSAAHCFEDCDAQKSTAAVAVGTAQKKRVTQKVEEVRMHEDYNQYDMIDDISIIMMQKELVFNNRVARIAIMKDPPYSAEAVVAGWGLINEEKETPAVTLKEATQTLVPRPKCVSRLGALPRHSFCAENKQGYAAQGDSGSALITHGFIQIGIVSYKIDEVSVALIVYTNVSSYYDWIENNMLEMHCVDKDDVVM